MLFVQSTLCAKLHKRDGSFCVRQTPILVTEDSHFSYGGGRVRCSLCNLVAADDTPAHHPLVQPALLKEELPRLVIQPRVLEILLIARSVKITQRGRFFLCKFLCNYVVLVGQPTAGLLEPYVQHFLRQADDVATRATAPAAELTSLEGHRRRVVVVKRAERLVHPHLQSKALRHSLAGE